jgi:hypothetical protein
MGRKTRICAVIAMTVALLHIGSSAQASTVTIGDPSLVTGSKAVGCGSKSACTFVGIGLPSQLGITRSPIEGRIISWRMVTFGNPPPGYAIRVMKAFEGQGDEFTGGATSAPVNPPSAVGGLQEFTADVPIEVGDYIGLDVPVNGTVSLGAGLSGSYGYFNPTLAVGETHSTGVFSPQLAFNAKIKPRPEVKAIGPTIGPAAGGTLVTIAGTELGDVVGVRFGDVPATAFTAESDERLTAMAPPVPSAQLVSLTVTTNGGTSRPVDAASFEYMGDSELPRLVAECLVPRVLGKKLAAARRQSRKAGCAIGRVRKRAGAGARTGRVVKQRPEGGAAVPIGTKIVVTLRKPGKCRRCAALGGGIPIKASRRR